MTVLLQYLLASHVFLGLLGTISFYAVWMGLLKKRLNLSYLRLTALAGLLFFLLSWFTGGYYYITYYGKAVKPIIKAGQIPWVHSVIMETKEHVFLFLPFLSAVVFLNLWLLKSRMEIEQGLKRELAFVTGFIVLLGIAMALAGVAVSGAVR